MSAFGELEAAVMEVVWDSDSAVSVKDVRTDLLRGREIAYTTVMTVMERLYRKRLLTRVTAGKAYLYRPALSRADYTSDAMASALADTHDRTAALVHFADKVSAREARTLLEALVARIERRPGPRR